VLAAIEALAERWAGQREERLQRTRLDAADFAALAETGFLRLVVPEADGGFWRSLNETGPVIIDAIYRLARGDHSVALVASMHPTVVALWTAAPPAPAEITDAFDAQCSAVFQSALDGHFWGTIASEPGSGGDVMRTKTIARAVDGSTSRFTMHGAKHFGSGSEIVSYMITTAKPEDNEPPGIFFLDLRDQPWDGTAGLNITREWDGVGMKATQSHAVMLDGVEGIPFAWPGAFEHVGPPVATLGLALFCSVVLAVVDAAMAEATNRLSGKSLRPYEDVAWAEAEVGHWMITQAHRGVRNVIAGNGDEDPALAMAKAKTGMATMAESTLTLVCRAVGGSAFSASSPFASWHQDVRALGFLRPPWGLAFDQLIEARQTNG